MELNSGDGTGTQETGPYNEADLAILKEGDQEQPQEQPPQEELIGGKFKTADDLLEAYQALEKKLGDRSGYQRTEEESKEGTEETEAKTDDLDGGPITQEEEQAILESVGGKDAFSKIHEWAKGALNEDELTVYNREVASGDYFRARNALQSMAFAYTESNGSEPDLIGGKLTGRTTDVYRSNQEVIEAMNDERYLKDDAYTRDVEEKLGRSNVLLPR
jgi:hypothetical protein